MADFPFVYPRQAIIAAGVTGTLQFLASNQFTLDVFGFITDTNTVGVNIVQLRDSTGNIYAQADTNNPIPIKLIANPANANDLSVFMFEQPLHIPQAGFVQMDIQNTTGGSVTINMIALCKKSTIQ